VLKSGIPWELLPQEMGCGSGMTCWRRLRHGQHAGVWLKLHQILRARLRGADQIDWSRAAVDSASARALGGGEGSGPNPTERGRPGVKHHVVVDAHGIPLAADVTDANVPDVQELLGLVDGSGPVGGKPGRPKQRPDALYADRAYDSAPHREGLRERGIEPKLAKRKTEHGSGRGVFRWVAERTLSWRHGCRKRRLVTEKGLDMQYAFLTLATAVICYRFL
jgi:transposase